MSTQGKIKTLFSDKEKTEALFPRTKLSAVSDENGKGLNAILDDMAYVGDITEDVVSTPVNADLLGGRPAGEYATQNYVANEIAKAQLEKEDIDLSGYATKDEMNAAIRAIDYPVDSVNGRTGAIVLNADDVGAAPDSILPQQATGNLVSVIDSGDAPLHGLKIYGKTIQNSTPTPENPVELVSVGASVNVTVKNKNLIPYPYYQQEVSGNTHVSNGGVTFTTNEDGSITMTGTNTASANADREYLFTKNNKVWLPVGEYTLSTGAELVTDFSWYLMAAMYSGIIAGGSVYARGGSIKFTVTEPGYLYVVLRVNANKAVNVTVYPQLEVGSVATEYEKPITAQTLTASTPNGLPGIPVSSGGNYTDENGQQWICDEIDFARGKYVQRAYQETYPMSTVIAGSVAFLTNTKKYGVQPRYIGDGNKKGMCSLLSNYFYGTNDAEHFYVDAYCYFFVKNENVTAFEANENVTVLYALATPIETDLTAEEIAQYAALHTNEPNTTVYNDAGAYMEMEYYSPVSAVPVDMGEGAKGKALVVDESGHVAPMKLTAADVGAAPSGYGLGVAKSEVEVTDYNNAVRNGWYRTRSDSANQPIAVAGWLRVDAYNENYLFQTFYSEYNNGRVAQRFKAQTWSKWEWIDPPMVPGVEYRTTERWNGKAVYTKLVNVASAGVGTTSIYHKTQMTQCLECKACESTNDTLPMKYKDSATDVVKSAYANSTQIIVYSTVAVTNIHCVLKYTKD